MLSNVNLEKSEGNCFKSISKTCIKEISYRLFEVDYVIDKMEKEIVGVLEDCRPGNVSVGKLKCILKHILTNSDTMAFIEKAMECEEKNKEHSATSSSDSGMQQMSNTSSSPSTACSKTKATSPDHQSKTACSKFKATSPDHQSKTACGKSKATSPDHLSEAVIAESSIKSEVITEEKDTGVAPEPFVATSTSNIFNQVESNGIEKQIPPENLLEPKVITCDNSKNSECIKSPDSIELNDKLSSKVVNDECVEESVNHQITSSERKHERKSKPTRQIVRFPISSDSENSYNGAIESVETNSVSSKKLLNTRKMDKCLRTNSLSDVSTDSKSRRPKHKEAKANEKSKVVCQIPEVHEAGRESANLQSDVYSDASTDSNKSKRPKHKEAKANEKSKVVCQIPEVDEAGRKSADLQSDIYSDVNTDSKSKRPKHKEAKANEKSMAVCQIPEVDEAGRESADLQSDIHSDVNTDSKSKRPKHKETKEKEKGKAVCQIPEVDETSRESADLQSDIHPRKRGRPRKNVSPPGSATKKPKISSEMEIKWSREEDKHILVTCQQFGANDETFKTIANAVRTKTVQQVKDRFQELMEFYQKVLKEGVVKSG